MSLVMVVALLADMLLVPALVVRFGARVGLETSAASNDSMVPGISY